jgi:hypothetical protein
MDRWTYRGLGAVLGLVIMAAAPLAAAPVDLLEADSQVFLQDNGAADVIYILTFRDNEGRRQIRKIGEFYEPVHFTRAAVEEAWRRLREAPPAQRPMIFDEEYRHLYLDDRFFENLQGSMAGVDIPDSLDSPLGALTSSRTVRTLEGAVSHVQEMAEGVVTSIENVAAATVDRVERFFAFDEMREAASADMRLHPLVFAGRMAEVTADRVSEEQLKAYFERIGNELSRAAAAR